MKRKYVLSVLAAALICLSSCRLSPGLELETESTTEAGYVYIPSVTQDNSVLESTRAEETSVRAEPESSSEEPTIQNTTEAAVVSTAAPVITTQAPTTASEADSTVDLSIDVPEVNGEMQVDVSPENKFIAKVSQDRKINADLLAAVYAVPASGQNYVFEFNSSSGRSAEDIRRVFLLDDSCNITSVAAVNSAEKEGVSSTENWFCMNVLIKRVVFPAIKDRL